MQDECWLGGSTVMVSSVGDLKSYLHDLVLNPVQEEMKTIHLFVSFVTYMDLMLRGYSISAFFSPP